MPIFVDSVEIESVFVDGVEQNEVFADGVLVFDSVPPLIPPEDIPQLYCAFDSDISNITLANANQVNGWMSLPEGSHPASAAAFLAAGQPFYINSDANFGNRASINFSDTSRNLSGSVITDAPPVFPATFAYVYKWNNITSSANKLMGVGALSGGGNGGIEAYQNAGVWVFNGGSLNIPWDNLAHIIIISINGANSQAWRDGISGGLVNNGTNSWIAFTVGNSNTGGPSGMLGQVAAWSVFNSPPLTPAERNGLGLYYADRFGLNWVVS